MQIGHCGYILLLILIICSLLSFLCIVLLYNLCLDTGLCQGSPSAILGRYVSTCVYMYVVLTMHLPTHTKIIKWASQTEGAHTESCGQQVVMLIQRWPTRFLC